MAETGAAAAASMSETVLEVEDVHTYIRQHHILQGVSIRVKRNVVTVLLGRNGAGKTTTMRSIMGLLHPAKGAIRFEGKAIERMPPYDIARLGVGFVPEGQGIFATLTVEENLRVAMHREDARSRERLARMLALFPDLHRFRRQVTGPNLPTYTKGAPDSQRLRQDRQGTPICRWSGSGCGGICKRKCPASVLDHQFFCQNVDV